MTTLAEQLSLEFDRWDRKGRGILPPAAVPVEPEPPFAPFTGYAVRDANGAACQGRRPTWFSRLMDAGRPQLAAIDEGGTDEDEAFRTCERGDIVEFRLSLPPGRVVSRDAVAACWSALPRQGRSVAFELVATPGRIETVVSVDERDADAVLQSLRAHFPEAGCVRTSDTLASAFAGGGHFELVECGLAREAMFELSPGGRIDPFVGLVGGLTGLQAGEAACYQVLFQPVRHDWPESLRRTLVTRDGSPVFAESDDLIRALKSKAAHPWFAVVLRIGARGNDLSGACELLRRAGASLGAYSLPAGNHLTPMVDGSVSADVLREEFVGRRSRRFGMLLTLGELVGLAHLPSPDVQSPELERQIERSKPAPDELCRSGGQVLGINEHLGESRTVRLPADDRVRHVHIIGASGSGKTTLLLNMIRDDIARGDGLALLDPQGDLVEAILPSIPDHRVDDVVLLDPGDETASVGFNVLSANSDAERALLASDLVGVFERLSTSWGDKMNVVLRNAILAFLESDRGGTLADLRRFLIDPGFRDNYLTSLRDPEVTYFWKEIFGKLMAKDSVSSLVIRLEELIAVKTLRHIVAQQRSTVDIPAIMDRGGILLAKLSHGIIGRGNASLLGSLLVAKIQQTALARQRMPAEARRDFWLYVDEFQNFITPSMAEVLAEARKYRLGLVLAHHDLRQLQRDPDVAAGVLNANVRIVFRISDQDAKVLADGFEGFGADDLRALDIGHAVCRVGRRDHDFNLRVPYAAPDDTAAAVERARRVIERSRERYATPREELLREEARGREAAAPSETVSGMSEPAPSPAPTRPEAAADRAPDGSSAIAAESGGRGGPLHKALQNRVADAARTTGLKVFPEHDVAGGRHRLDLFVEGTNLRIACEIVVTSRIDKEIATFRGCLATGFDAAVLVCPDHEKLAAAQAEITREFPDENVNCILPAQATATFRSLASSAERGGGARERKFNHDIERHPAPELSEDERQRRLAETLETLAEAMRGEAQR